MKKLALLWFCSLTLNPLLHGAPPKLIVAILVDQLRYDYLERFHDQFATNGFRRLMDHGAFMTGARYDYAPTLTGPGHATFLSGALPAMHGIIANNWFDRKTGKETGCVDDESVDGVAVTLDQERSSPKNFIGDGFADELRLRFGSKVISISLKNRAAILPGGKKPAGVYWFHSANGNFITSTYYREQLPEWVRAFNRRQRAADFMGRTWDRLLDARFYPYPDAADGEDTLPGGKTNTFPHVVAASTNGYDNIVTSPFGNELLAEFAEATVEGENLGQGDRPDLLCISFSSLDHVGHRFGPYSHEVQDMVLRLDRELARFLGFLDQKLGLENVMLLLTSDHGVAPTPEFARQQGLDGERLDEPGFLKELDEHLDEEFGPGRWFLPAKLFGGNLYLNHETLQRQRVSAGQVASVARDFALASGKFQACYSREQLLEGRAPGPIGQLVANGYDAGRGGDLVLITKPYIISREEKSGTTHGAPYSYDTRVPVLFHGAAFKPGRHANFFVVTDIVPTLCAALRMNEPAGCTGRPFIGLLAEP